MPAEPANRRVALAKEFVLYPEQLSALSWALDKTASLRFTMRYVAAAIFVGSRRDDCLGRRNYSAAYVL